MRHSHKNRFYLYEGIKWDKKYNPYCPQCEKILTNYKQDNNKKIYTIDCILCKSTINLSIRGNPYSLESLQDNVKAFKHYASLKFKTKRMIHNNYYKIKKSLKRTS